MVMAKGPVSPREPRDVRQVALTALELALDALQWAASRRTGPSLAEATTVKLDHALRLVDAGSIRDRNADQFRRTFPIAHD